ncbi:MAG: hypothetical protein Q7T55_24315, partial [Solirubrobacteraceae bacterium]|nr:hypothetical protein [Solirubrobacteraceae bacterium]
MNNFATNTRFRGPRTARICGKGQHPRTRSVQIAFSPPCLYTLGIMALQILDSAPLEHDAVELLVLDQH